MIRHYHIAMIAEELTAGGDQAIAKGAKSVNEALLLWCQQKTRGYANCVPVQDFHKSWRDGMAFNALIHSHRPEAFDFAQLNPTDRLANLNHAFDIAADEFGVPRLLDAEDVAVDDPDEKSIIIYVTDLYSALNRAKTEETGSKRISNFLNDMQNGARRAQQYEANASGLLDWIRRKVAWLESRGFPNTVAGLQEEKRSFNQYLQVEKFERFGELTNLEVLLYDLQTLQRNEGHRVYTPQAGATLEDLGQAWARLEAAEQAREAALVAELLRQLELEKRARHFTSVMLPARLKTLAELGSAVASLRVGDDSLKEAEDAWERLLRVQSAIHNQEAIRFEPFYKAAQRLIEENYHDKAVVARHRDDVSARWAGLTEAFAEKEAALRPYAEMASAAKEVEVLRAQLQALRESVTSCDTGTDLMSCENFLARHRISEQELIALHEQVNRIAGRARRLCDGRTTGAPAMSLSQKLMALEEDYQGLLQAFADRRRRLETARDFLQLIRSCEDEDSWLAEKLAGLGRLQQQSADGHGDLRAARRFVSRLQTEEAEIEHRQAVKFAHLCSTCESAQLQDGADNCSDIDDGDKVAVQTAKQRQQAVSDWLSRLRSGWRDLRRLLHACQADAAQRLDAQQFFASAGEADDHMAGVAPLLAGRDVGHDAGSAAALLKRHQYLRKELQAFGSAETTGELAGLRETAKRLTSDGDAAAAKAAKANDGKETTDDVHSSLGDEEEDDDFNEGEEQSAEDSAVADGDEDPLIAVEEPYEELVTEMKMQEAEEPRRIQRVVVSHAYQARDPKKRDLSAGKGDIFELLQKTNKDWYSVRDLTTNKRGFLPAIYLTEISPTTVTVRVPRPVEVTVGVPRTRTVFKRASELENGAVGVRRPTFRRSAGDLHRRSRRRLSRWRRRGQRRGRCLPESERTAIRHRMEKLDATFADLQALATARERSLAQAVRQFRFFELAEAFNDWLAGKEAALAADEPPYLVLANGSAAVRKRCEQHFQEMAANKGRLDELDGLAKELLADAAAAAKEAAAVAGSAELTAETGPAAKRADKAANQAKSLLKDLHERWDRLNKLKIEKEKKLADSSSIERFAKRSQETKEQLEERRDLLAERRDPGQNLASNAAQLAHHRHLCHELDALKARAAELDYEGRAVKEVHPSESAFIDARLEKLADLAELVSEMAGGRERELCERREKLLLEAEAAKALKRLEEASLAGPLSPARSGTAGFAQQHQQQRRLTSVDEPATGDDEEQQLDQLLASTEALEQSLDAQLAAAGAPRDPQLLALRQRLRAKRGALTDEVQRRRRERQTEATARRFLRDADRAAAGLAAWQRRLAGLRSTQEVDAAASAGLEPLSQRVADLTARWESAQSPRTELAQEDRQKVESRLATANEALASARAATERRRRELRDAAELADFDVAADELAEWLAEKRPSVEDRSHRKAGGDIDRRRMRHRAFEAEMAAQAPQLEKLRKAAQQLQAKGHPDAQEALNRLEEVESLWSSIETAAAEKGTELDEAQKERQLMERLEAVVEQTDRLAKEAARAPVVEDERSARAQQERQEYLEERLAQCAVQTAELAQLAKELAGRGHYNSEAILAAVGKQEAACDSLAPQLAERRHQLDKAEADRQLAASLDRELLWADERLMSAAAVANSAKTAPPKTPEAERLLQQSQAGLQTELATRRAAVEKLLQQAEAAGGGRDGGEKAKQLVEKMEKLEAVLAQREEQLQQAALAKQLSVERAESEQRLDDCALLLVQSDELAADVLAAAAASPLEAGDPTAAATAADPNQQRQAAEKALKRLAGLEQSLADLASAIPESAEPDDPRRRRLSELRREAAEQRAALEARRDRARLAAEVADAREQIDSHLVTAASEEYGTDAEQCARLRDAFDDFQATALAPLKARVAALQTEAETAGEADEAMAKMAQDLGDYLRLLEHYAECRADNLAKAAEVHEYNRDACELMQAAEEKLLSIPSELGRDASALEKYTARHYVLLQELVPLEERLAELRDRSASLSGRLDPDNAKLIAARQRRVEDAFDRLETRQQERVRQLEGAHELLALARQRQAVKSWLDDARPEMDDLLAKLADNVAPAEAAAMAESADELAGQLNERLADVKMLADEGERLCDREEGEEFNEEIEKIVDDAIAMKAVLDDRLAGLERRATAFRAVGDFADKVRQAQQALASVESRAAVLAPSVESASSEQVEQLRRELEALKVLCERAAAQRLPACRDSAAAANALAPGVLAEEERRSIETRLASLEAQAERASARIEAALSALICRSDYLDYVTADAEINDLIGSQLARVAAVSADAKEADDRRRRPQQLLRLQDFKDAADAQRDRVERHLQRGRTMSGPAAELAEATGAAWDRLSAAFEERAQALETARSLLRLLADCERAENALLEVKPLLDAYQATGGEATEEADAFLYDALLQLPVDQERIDALLADAAALSSSAAAASSGDTADPEVAAAASRAKKVAQSWSESRPRLDQCRQELDAKVRYHRFRRAGDELDRELDRLGELLDADDAAVSEGDSASVADRIQRNCRVRDTEAKKLAGLLAKMTELRDEFDAAGIYPQAGAACKRLSERLEALRRRCDQRDRRLQDERRCADVADGVRAFCDWAADFADRRLAEEEAAGAVAAQTVEEAERRLALNRDRRTELERRLAEAAKLRLRAADLATASTVAAADGEGGGGGIDFAMALKEPREQLEAARLRLRQRFERHSEILSGDAACAQLAERVASVGRSLHSLESRLSEAAATAAAAVADDEDDPSPTLTLEPSTSISASTAASELRQLRDRLAECQEACDALPPGGRHAAAVADQLSNERRRCDVVAALVDAAAKRHAAGDRLAAYLQHCDNFRLRLEARLLRLDVDDSAAAAAEEAEDSGDDDASRRGTERLETLLAEVRGYSRQLDSLAEEGDQLTEALDSAMARRAVSDRMEQLRKLHGEAVERCSQRLSRARRAYSIRQLLQRCRDLDRFCRTVNEAVELSVAAVAKGGKGGGGLGRAKQAQKELAGLLADLEARGDALKEAEAALAELLDRGGDGDEKVDEGVATCRLVVERLRRRFDALRRLLRAHGAGLGRAVRLLHYLVESEDEAAWLEGRTAALAGTDVGRSSADVQRLSRRLRRSQEEADNRRPLVAALLDAGKALLAQTEESFDSAGEKAATAATGDLDDDEEEVDEESARMWREFRASDTRRCTERLRTALAALDRALERRRGLLADAERLFAYLDELGELRAWIEDRLAGLTALETAVAEADDDSACLARAKTTEALLADAETAAERVKELAATAKLLDHDMVDERQAEAKRLSDSLISRLKQLKRRLEETLTFFEFSEQVEELQAWLRRQEAALRSIEPGTDEESCERSADRCAGIRAALRQRQPQLDQLDARLQSLQAEKNCRLESARTMRDRLQTQLAGVHLAAKDLAKTLHDSRRIHRLLYEAASLHEALQEKLREVESLASYGAGPVPTEELLRRLAMLTDSEFKPLAARRDDLGRRSRLLTEEFKGTDAEQVIRDDVSAVERLWQELSQAAEAKRRDLLQAKEAHASLAKFADLLPALQALLADILAEELARDFKSALEQVDRSSQRAKDVKRRDLQAQDFARSVARWSRECPASLAEHLAERVQAVNRQLELVQSTHRRRHEIYLENADIRKVLERCDGLDRWLDEFGREFEQCAPAFDGPAAEQLEARGRRSDELTALLLAQAPRVEALRELTLLERRFQEQQRAEAEQNKGAAASAKRTMSAAHSELTAGLLRRQTMKAKEQEEQQRLQKQQQQQQQQSPSGKARPQSVGNSGKIGNRTFSTKKQRGSGGGGGGRLSDLMPPSIEGELEARQELQSGGVKNPARKWKKRYAALCGHLLALFKDKTAYNTGDRALHSLVIYAAQCETDSEHRNSLRLQLKDGSLYLLMLPSNQDCLAWRGQIKFRAGLDPSRQLVEEELQAPVEEPAAAPAVPAAMATEEAENDETEVTESLSSEIDSQPVAELTEDDAVPPLKSQNAVPTGGTAATVGKKIEEKKSSGKAEAAATSTQSLPRISVTAEASTAGGPSSSATLSAAAMSSAAGKDKKKSSTSSGSSLFRMFSSGRSKKKEKEKEKN
ncbi:hypothetical protein BOX15_Mlig002032g2 [Macrostomum lignano]|uniref:SH3 domain-containing protein n=1 Tax=Macrostomum lignano TaxID=282301 RepID=A0A267E9U1_9PLAT|nr:hypothetical protein BOX15_Mlig002032g2 [Macrostomum lignano]